MIDHKAISTAIASNYLAAHLTMGNWSGQHSDKAAAAELNASKSAVADASRVTKNLLAGADAELKAVKAAQTAIRTYYYMVTLPYSTSEDGPKRGPRLLAVTRSLEVLRNIKVLQDDFKNRLDEFCAVYTQRRDTALAEKLGGLGDASLYPDASDIRAEFRVKFRADTIGATTDFSRLQSIPPELANFLADRKGNEVREQVNAAMAEMQSRTLEAVRRMANSLGKTGRGEKTKLFGSLITNLHTMVTFMEDSNVSQNDEVTALADRIKAELLQHEIEAYRGNEGLAAEVAKKAEVLASELPDFDWSL